MEVDLQASDYRKALGKSQEKQIKLDRQYQLALARDFDAETGVLTQLEVDNSKVTQKRITFDDGEFEVERLEISD